MAPALAALLLPLLVVAASEPPAPPQSRPAAEPAAETNAKPAAEPLDVAWRWPDAGEPAIYRFVRTSDETMPVPGKDPVFRTEIVQRIAHERAATETGESDAAPDSQHADQHADQPGTPVRLTWLGIRYAILNAYSEPLIYDSDDDQLRDLAHHPAIGPVAAALDQSLIYRIAPDGDLLAVEDLDPMLRGMEINLSRWGLADQTTYERLQQVFTPAVLLDTTEPLYRFLPNRPVRPGDTHEITRVLTLPKVGLVRTRETHTFTGMTTADDGTTTARFEVSGEVEWPRPSEEIAQLFSVSINDSRIEGSWTYDPARGLPTTYDVETFFRADVVEYDPRSRTSNEITTVQTIRDSARLVDASARNTEPAPEAPPEPGGDE